MTRAISPEEEKIYQGFPITLRRKFGRRRILELHRHEALARGERPRVGANVDVQSTKMFFKPQRKALATTAERDEADRKALVGLKGKQRRHTMDRLHKARR